MQVFDLAVHKPHEVLEMLWANFAKYEKQESEEHKGDGSKSVAALRERLRVVAAGGDGTVAWVLQVRLLIIEKKETHKMADSLRPAGARVCWGVLGSARCESSVAGREQVSQETVQALLCHTQTVQQCCSRRPASQILL
jgi:Diacylglycerol kinase catalytic domain